MRRTTVSPKQIYAFANEFLAAQRRQGRYGPGRPKLYNDALIISIACVQNLYSFSFRETLEFCESQYAFLPVLSGYHYRLRQLPADTIRKFIEFLGAKIKEEGKTKISLFIVDGTGFSYKDDYPMKFYRGIEIRKIRAHVKVGALAGVLGKKRFILSAMAGPPYTHDLKLIEPLLPVINSGGYVLGDKIFDCIRFIQKILAAGCFPAIDIKESRLYSIKSPFRLFSKYYAGIKELYKNRTLIEGLFGNLKQPLSSHIKTFNLNIAQNFALLRFALYNMATLVGMRKSRVWIWIFEQPRELFDKIMTPSEPMLE
jgi:hypothetical protein